MGLLTWAKHKSEENWPISFFEVITKVEGFLDVGWGEKFELKKKTNFFIKRHTMKRNGTKGKTFQKGKSPNNFKA